MPRMPRTLYRLVSILAVVLYLGASLQPAAPAQASGTAGLPAWPSLPVFAPSMLGLNLPFGLSFPLELPWFFGPAPSVSLAPPRSAPLAPDAIEAVGITATKSATLGDLDADNKADAGETLTYTVTLRNTGTTTATGVIFDDTPDVKTTLNAGSVRTYAAVVDDSYTTWGNTPITVPAVSGVLANDFNPATGNNTGLTVQSNTAPTQAGASLTLNPDGSFTYTPPPGFSNGTDTFTYTVTGTGAGAPTNTATVTITVVNATIWFVDDSASVGGNGRQSTPYNCLVGTNDASPYASS